MMEESVGSGRWVNALRGARDRVERDLREWAADAEEISKVRRSRHGGGGAAGGSLRTLGQAGPALRLDYRSGAARLSRKLSNRRVYRVARDRSRLFRHRPWRCP